MGLRYEPLLLAFATISLYPALPDGSPNLSLPIWLGASAENLKLPHSVEQREVTETGNASRQMQDLGENHEIQMERVWAVAGATFRPWQPVRGQKFVLNIAWTADARVSGPALFAGKCYQRTYYGVQWTKDDVSSRGQMESLAEQGFRAESMV